MKKFLFVAALFCVALLSANSSAFAQKNLAFKGIEIDGQRTDVIQKLKTQKCTLNAEYHVMNCLQTMLKGSYTDIENCSISIVSYNERVWQMGVALPIVPTWNDVIVQYDKFKSDFSIKYSLEPYPTEVSSTKGAIKWETYFVGPNGNVLLRVFDSGEAGFRLFIYYSSNSIPEEINKEELMRSITNNMNTIHEDI